MSRVPFLILATLLPVALGFASTGGTPLGAVAPRSPSPACTATDGGSAAASSTDGLPVVPIRAPRRLRRGEAPHQKQVEDAPRGARGRGARRGGSTGPKGKAAVVARPQGRSAQLRELQRLTITGGSARGRRLVTPAVYMRPMMSRVREALFSMLYPTGVLRDSAHHLDLFAGSGAVGLESLSRGMGAATFVDFSNVCCEAIRSNAETIGVGERARVVEAKVDSFLADPARYGADRPFDLVAITPPYEEVVYADLVTQLAASDAIGEDTLVVIEYPVELGCFPPTLADGLLVGLRNRRYGRTVIALYVYRPSGKIDVSPFSEEVRSVCPRTHTARRHRSPQPTCVRPWQFVSL